MFLTIHVRISNAHGVGLYMLHVTALCVHIVYLTHPVYATQIALTGLCITITSKNTTMSEQSAYRLYVDYSVKIHCWAYVCMLSTPMFG